MKYFFVLLFFFAVKIENGLTQEKQVPGYLASVSEYPFHLHKCTATFVTTKHLLTTAACVFCQDTCRQVVKVIRSYNPQEGGLLFRVVRTAFYPSYLNDKEENNVGIIEIDNKGIDIPYIPVSNESPKDAGIEGFVYGWLFNNEMTSFELYKFDVQTVSNTMCSDVLDRYISPAYSCVLSSSLISRGPFDQGSPLIAHVEGQPTILGIYNHELLITNSTVIPYHLMPSFYSWIDEQIKV